MNTMINEEWSSDIGTDELNDNLFQTQVSNDKGDIVANAMGETPEESIARGRLIAQSTKMAKVLKRIYSLCIIENEGEGEDLIYEIEEIFEEAEINLQD
jgi:DNA polymerase III delta prime subunit